MTTTETMKLALDALENNTGEYRIEGAATILRTAIAKAEKQEPAPGYCKHCKQYTIEEPLPAAQRQWVGLTDEEIDEWTPEIHSVIQAIEAKLKEKNT